ncbi:hypothetical protein BKP56_09075 [Marinilactibacillus sp. 15R]|uniref:hypothetical protein n=1 Tax=Marinilactibacillus sp. 15R TaxID=1911586 RepID=UPI00090B4EB6|nr:hypothetical protein [Marinilactibacillus sp. 15R]API89395.1 hypothetical protein BKP56_09075 [Marinilactibacillus sp. 15R]
MKSKLALLSLYSLVLMACGDDATDVDNTEKTEIQEVTQETEQENITFTSGVSGETIPGNEQNYVDITGTAEGFESVYVIYDGAVIDELSVDADGNWEYYSNGGDRSAQLDFTTDDSISFGDTNINVNDLNYVYTMFYEPNPDANIEEVEDDSQTSTDSTSGSSSELGQRSNPVPYEEILYMHGTFTDYDANYAEFEADLEMNIVDTIRGEEAWNIIINENQFNDPAPEGKEYIINRVKLKLLNATSEDLKTSFMSNEFDYISESGASYSSVSVVLPDELDVELYNNGEAEGNIVGLVDVGDKPLVRFNQMFFLKSE